MEGIEASVKASREGCVEVMQVRSCQVRSGQVRTGQAFVVDKTTSVVLHNTIVPEFWRRSCGIVCLVMVGASVGGGALLGGKPESTSHGTYGTAAAFTGFGRV